MEIPDNRIQKAKLSKGGTKKPKKKRESKQDEMKKKKREIEFSCVEF